MHVSYTDYKLLKGQRYYSTTTYPILNPWFITGFVDAEGAFMLTFNKTKEARLGYRIRPIFQIQLHKKDVELLRQIQQYFGGIGYITEGTKDCLAFRVRSLEEIIIIVAHFDKFPLITQKRADFELFKCVVAKLLRKEHLKLKGLQEVVNIRASMNLGLTDALKVDFPETVPVIRPLVKITEEINPQWLAGFTTGEGCFFINIAKSSSNLIGYQVFLLYALTQHSRDRKLLEIIKEYFGCGEVKGSSTRINILTLKITKFSSIFEKIIPFYKKYPVQGVKSLDYKDWCEAAELIKGKKHLTREGLERIKQIKARMNRGRL